MKMVDPIAQGARRLRLGAMAVGLGLGAMLVAAVLLPGPAVHLGPASLPRPAALALSAAEIAVVWLALFRLAAMLRRIERGERFSAGVTHDFRRFAAWLVSAAFVRIVMPPVLATLLALANGGHGRVELGLADGDLVALLVSALLFFVARLFDEAAQYELDSRAII